jgi:ferrochelatase
MAKEVILLLAHGTPDSIEEIPAYLRNVVSGRPMPEEVIKEIQHRYSLIGKSPLTVMTNKQADSVSRESSMPVCTSACGTGNLTSIKRCSRWLPTA